MQEQLQGRFLLTEANMCRVAGHCDGRFHKIMSARDICRQNFD